MTSDTASAVVAPYRHLVADVDRVTDDLERFCALVGKWNRAQNLVSRETADTLWQRHIADSLQLLPLLRPRDLRLIDLGSGGGFPALPLAIASRGTARHFSLVEASAKKAVFLRAVIRELGLGAAVAPQRIEDFASRETAADVITSRALAALPALLRLAFPLFSETTRGLFHKGREHGEELAAGSLAWDFDVVIHDSVTGSGGIILEVSHLRPKESRPEAES